MPATDSEKVMRIRYKFQFENGEEKLFDVLLNEQTLQVVQRSNGRSFNINNAITVH
jgi:hypothetical protein